MPLKTYLAPLAINVLSMHYLWLAKPWNFYHETFFLKEKSIILEIFNSWKYTAILECISDICGHRVTLNYSICANFQGIQISRMPQIQKFCDSILRIASASNTCKFQEYFTKCKVYKFWGCHKSRNSAILFWGLPALQILANFKSILPSVLHTCHHHALILVTFNQDIFVYCIKTSPTIYH